MRGSDGIHHPVPDACFPPSHKAVIAGGARAIAFGENAPWRTGAQHPEDAVQHAAIINARHTSRLIGQKRFDYAPLEVGQVISAHADAESALAARCNQIAANCQPWQNARVKRKTSLYLRLRRFVDHDQATRVRPATPFLGILPIALAGVIQSHLSTTAATWTWVIAVIIGSAWTVFAWWRGYRLFKAFGVRGDRQFDERDKFALAPEYHASESATKARQKRRIARQRNR